MRTLVAGAAALAVFCACFFFQWRSGAFKKVEAVTSATVKVHEFAALAALKAPFAEKTDIAGVEISRLALGGDLIAGHAHARDLIWTDEFMRRYNSGAALPRTVRYCLHCGIDAVFAEPAFLADMTRAARTGAFAASGTLKFFANCANADEAAKSAAGGAKAVYVRPEAADALARAGDSEALRALFEGVGSCGLPAGIGAEDVETVRFCVDNGIKPDFWVLAFHSTDYPAAKLKTRCNNIWCVDPKAAAEYMKSRPEPWVAVRCMAGGAFDPAAAYRFAMSGGASAAAIDLVDYRIVETVNALTAKDKPAQAAKGDAK